LIALIIISVPGSLLAKDSKMPATGLKEPTAVQAEWMKQHFQVIQKIRLNSLALERINDERKVKGLAQISQSRWI